MELVVRRAALADARAIASIHVRGWQVAYAGLINDTYLNNLNVEEREATWAVGLRAGVMPDGGSIFVAERAGRVVGWLTCGPSRDAGAAMTTGELHGIYVDPHAWASGIGSALMAECLTILRDAGFIQATLWVLAENIAARRWYEHRGWAADETTATFEIAGEPLVEVRYHRTLT